MPKACSGSWTFIKGQATAFVSCKPLRLGRTDGRTDGQTDGRRLQFLGPLYDNHPFGVDKSNNRIMNYSGDQLLGLHNHGRKSLFLLVGHKTTNCLILTCNPSQERRKGKNISIAVLIPIFTLFLNYWYCQSNSVPYRPNSDLRLCT